MMKKIMLMLSLIVIGLFLVSCAPELQDGSDATALTGQAGATLGCKLVEFKSDTQTGDAVCKSISRSGSKKCYFTFGSIYYRVHVSTDGSCTGDTLWTIPEPIWGGMMYQPMECSQTIQGAAVFQIPALNKNVTDMTGVTSNGGYCFKGEAGSFEGHDIWVSKEKTKQQALCC